MDHKRREAREVEQMFNGIADRYDLLNHVLSFGLDFRWRRRVAQETRKIDCRRILDVCTGTGDMAIELCRYWKGDAHIDAIDFSRRLIGIGQQKVKRAQLNGKIIFMEADAEKLPYKDGYFDAITIAFGLRNINDRLKALSEFYRVATQGGIFICLEFSTPPNKILNKIYSFYLTEIVPIISLVLGSDPDAYRYLGRTIRDFPSPQELSKLIELAGWKKVKHYYLAGGIVSMHRGIKY